MNQQKTGGPAFPVVAGSGEEQGRDYDGLSIRDYFAAAALTGLLAGLTAGQGRASVETSSFAASAYGLADAMLAERKK